MHYFLILILMFFNSALYSSEKNEIRSGSNESEFVYRTGFKPNEKALAYQAFISFDSKNLSEEQIIQHIENIRNVGKHFSLNDKELINQLQKLILDKIEMHKPHINLKYDFDSLKQGLKAAGVSLICAKMAYHLCKWIKSDYDERAMLYQKTRDMGVRVEEVYGVNYITFKLYAPKNLNADELVTAYKYFYKEVDFKRLGASPGFTVLFSGAISLYSTAFGLKSFYRWIFPDHKKQYDKFSLIKEKLDLIVVAKK